MYFGVASFQGPAQLFVACSMEKWEEPGIFFSREHDIIDKGQKKLRTKKRSFTYCSPN